MTSPYNGLPTRSFWKSGVAEQDIWTIRDLYRKRFEIGLATKIATAGSCFAQHISSNLRARQFTVLDLEPAPRGLSVELARKWGYGLYSARYGNIYLVRQLLQLTREAFGLFAPTDAVWEKDGRYFDALRPSVEPNGLESAEAVLVHRESHLKHVRRIFEEAEVFVFTMGLTEGWVHGLSGTVYPTAPGTIAGRFDPQVYSFKNFTFGEVLDDFLAFRALVRENNPNIKFLLTVSPVPLTATASDQHVLCSTTYSKAVLRAVAGELCQRYADIDYFPSFEVISSALSRGLFFENNLRSVTDEGVRAVMRIFFSEHGTGLEASLPAKEGRRRSEGHRSSPMQLESRGRRRKRRNGQNEIVCEDVLLEAFSR